MTSLNHHRNDGGLGLGSSVWLGRMAKDTADVRVSVSSDGVTPKGPKSRQGFQIEEVQFPREAHLDQDCICSFRGSFRSVG